MVSIEDRIFPSGPARDGHILRLEFVDSWESQLIGLGRLTSFLSPRLLRQSHAVDDMGLYVIFMQRHRVEVGLKLLLERTDTQPTYTHDIRQLLELCASSVIAKGLSREWAVFSAMQAEYINLMHEIDSGAATYRYPVDKHAKSWGRRRFVDLEALEIAGTSFQEAILDLTETLAMLEPLPITTPEAEITAQELQRLVVACDRCIETQKRTVASVRAEGERVLGSHARGPHHESADVYIAGAAAEEVTAALAARAGRMLNRIVTTHEVNLGRTVETISSPIPPLRLSPDPQVMRAQQDAQIKWMAEEMSKAMKPLAVALEDSHRRSTGWSTPAARQLHLDIARFRSRFFKNWDA
jgi:hypothetical protein